MLVAAGLLLTVPAFAELGGVEASIKADQARVQGTRTVMRGQAYAVHEIRTPNRSVLREFVSPAGKVFAVTYSGSSLGESNQLMGSYSAEIAVAMKSVHGGRHVGGPVILHMPGVVYEAVGHMRSYTVRAYVTDSVPEGVKLEEIR